MSLCCVKEVLSVVIDLFENFSNLYQSRDTNDSKVVSSLKEEIAQLRRENEQLKGANGNGGNKNISRPGSSDSRKLAQLESEAAEKEQKYKVIQVSADTVKCFQKLLRFSD